MEEQHIEKAYARVYLSRPKGFGIEVIGGAFTLWTQRTNPLVFVVSGAKASNREPLTQINAVRAALVGEKGSA